MKSKIIPLNSPDFEKNEEKDKTIQEEKKEPKNANKPEKKPIDLSNNPNLKPKPKIDREKVFKLLDEGKTPKEIAEITGYKLKSLYSIKSKWKKKRLKEYEQKLNNPKMEVVEITPNEEKNIKKVELDAKEIKPLNKAAMEVRVKGISRSVVMVCKVGANVLEEPLLEDEEAILQEAFENYFEQRIEITQKFPPEADIGIVLLAVFMPRIVKYMNKKKKNKKVMEQNNNTHIPKPIKKGV